MEFFNERGSELIVRSFAHNDANALFLVSDKYNSDQKAAHWPEGLISKSGKYAKEKILEGKVNSEPADTAETSDPEAETSQTSETT